MLRRNFLSAVSAAGLACTLPGCDSKNDQYIKVNKDDGKKEEAKLINYLGYRADARNLVAIEEQLHRYMEENPDVNIVYEGIKGRLYHTALEKRAMAGVLDDIFMLDKDRIMKLKDMDCLSNLYSSIPVNNYLDFLFPQLLIEQNRVVAVPCCITFYGFYVNEDLLKKEGIPVPTDLSSLKRACEIFKSKGYKPIVGNNWSSLHCCLYGHSIFPLLKNNNESEVIASFNRDPSLLANALEPGIDLAAEFLKNGWFDGEELLRTEQTSDDLKLFKKGDRPFMITGGWASARLLPSEMSFSFRVYPLPVLEDGAILPVKADTNIAVCSYTKHPKEVLQFLDFLIKPENLWDYCNSQNSFMPYKNSKLPESPVIRPAVEFIGKGRNVFFSDFRLQNLKDNSFLSMTDDLSRGESAEKAKEDFLKQFAKKA